MPDSIEALRAEVEQLKEKVAIQDARIWALADFFGQLNDALGLKAEPVYREFMNNLRELYRGAGDREQDLQKSFRGDTFVGL